MSWFVRMGTSIAVLILAFVLFTGCQKDSESDIDPTQTEVFFFSLDRPPIQLTEALSLIETGRTSIVDIAAIPHGATFQLQADPSRESREWVGIGYAVNLIENGPPLENGPALPLAVQMAGQSAIGLDDDAVARLLQAVSAFNQAHPCSIEVYDHRSVDQWPSAGASSEPDCYKTTATPD